MKKVLTIAALLMLVAGWAYARNDIVADSLANRAVPYAKLSVACTTGDKPGTCSPQTDGTTTYCNDCQVGPTCVGGGAGTMAIHQGGNWTCGNTANPNLLACLLYGQCTLSGLTLANQVFGDNFTRANTPAGTIGPPSTGFATYQWHQYIGSGVVRVGAPDLHITSNTLVGNTPTMADHSVQTTYACASTDGTSCAQLAGGNLIGSAAVYVMNASSQITTFPAKPVIVSGFVSGSTQYYWCVGEDVNGRHTPLSTGTGTVGTTGTMSCGGQANAVKYDLLKSATLANPTGTGNYLIASCNTTSGVSCNIADAGISPSNFVVGDITAAALISSVKAGKIGDGTVTPFHFIHISGGNAIIANLSLWDSVAGGGPFGNGSSRAFSGGCVRTAGTGSLSIGGGGLGPNNITFAAPLVMDGQTPYVSSLFRVPGQNSVVATFADGTTVQCNDPLIANNWGNGVTYEESYYNDALFWPYYKNVTTFMDAQITSFGTFTGALISNTPIDGGSWSNAGAITGTVNTASGGNSIELMGFAGSKNAQAFGLTDDDDAYPVLGGTISGSPDILVSNTFQGHQYQGVYVPQAAATTSTAQVTGGVLTTACSGSSGCTDNASVYNVLGKDSQGGTGLKSANIACVSCAAQNNLSKSNYNRITWSALGGGTVVSYIVCKNGSIIGTSDAAKVTFYDTGQPVAQSAALLADTGILCPAAATRRGLSALINSVTDNLDGTETLHLNFNASVTNASTNAYHDNQAILLSYLSTGGSFELPSGTQVEIPSARTGHVYLAFQYIGSPTFDRSWMIHGIGTPHMPSTEVGDGNWYDLANYGGPVFFVQNQRFLNFSSVGQNILENIGIVMDSGNNAIIETAIAGTPTIAPVLRNVKIGNCSNAIADTVAGGTEGTITGGSWENLRISGCASGLTMNAGPTAAATPGSAIIQGLSITNPRFHYNKRAISFNGSKVNQFHMSGGYFLSDGAIASNDMFLGNISDGLIDSTVIDNPASAVANYSVQSTTSNLKILGLHDISASGIASTNAGTNNSFENVVFDSVATMTNTGAGTTIIPCKGDVTLSTGAGTFTAGCVIAKSSCNSKDITTPANACTVAAPAAGSVAITGTGSDVCRTWCN